MYLDSLCLYFDNVVLNFVWSARSVCIANFYQMGKTKLNYVRDVSRRQIQSDRGMFSSWREREHSFSSLARYVIGASSIVSGPSELKRKPIMLRTYTELFYSDWNPIGLSSHVLCHRNVSHWVRVAISNLLYVHKWLVTTIDCKAFKKYYNSKITTKAVHTIK